MIYFITKAAHTYTVTNYLDTWGRPLASRIRLLPYPTLVKHREAKAGTYIFCDIDRLSRNEMAAAVWMWNRLAQARPAIRVLNHPGRVLLRYELLETLYSRGINRFQAYRLNEKGKVKRFPVFIRHWEHSGSRTPLLRTLKEMEQAIAKLRFSIASPSHFLIVEYCPTEDSAGIFRKYSAFFVDGEVIPRHLIFSHNWVLKLPDLIDAEKLREERAYLEENPHREWITKIFQLAHIDYGRIDYGLFDGKPQVWEINTNPIIMLRPERYNRDHLENQKFFAERIDAVFRSVDIEEQGASRIEIKVPAQLSFPLQLEDLLRKARRCLSRLVPRPAKKG